MENNERSVDDFESGGNQNSALQDQRIAVAGDQLINQLNKQIKGNKTDGPGNVLRSQNSVFSQSEASNNYLRL